MNELALRPRSATEIIDLSVRLLRQHFVPFVLLGLVGTIPNVVVQLLLILSVGASDPAAIASRVRAATFITWPVVVVFTSLMISAVTVLADRVLRGEPAEVGPALQAGARRLGPVIGVGFLVGLASGIGFVLLVIPGVYVACRLMTATPTCVVEETGVLESLKRAWDRGRGHVMHALKLLLLLFLIFLVFGTVVGVVSVAVGLIGGAAQAGLLSFVAAQVLNGLLTAAISPLLGIAALLLMYDLRVRREGYDLEVMAGAVGAAP